MRYDMTWIQHEGCLEFRSSESALELQWIKDVLRFSHWDHWADSLSWCMSQEAGISLPWRLRDAGEMLGRCWELHRSCAFSIVFRHPTQIQHGQELDDKVRKAGCTQLRDRWRICSHLAWDHIGIYRKMSERYGKMAIWCNLWTSQKLNKKHDKYDKTGICSLCSCLMLSLFSQGLPRKSAWLSCIRNEFCNAVPDVATLVLSSTWNLVRHIQKNKHIWLSYVIMLLHPTWLRWLLMRFFVSGHKCQGLRWNWRNSSAWTRKSNPRSSTLEISWKL